MKYYLIAGEASGDLHGSNLMKALSRLDNTAEFRYWGGDLMQEQGGICVKHIREISFMGFREVIINIREIIRNFSFCKKDLLKFKPDIVILIDYPGFNLRMAQFAFKTGIKTCYYITPQVWAWKKNRVFKIKKYANLILCILPFEKNFFNSYNISVEFVGHPLLDAIEEHTYKPLPGINKKIIALLPGSRKQEISTMLPIYLEAVKNFSDYSIVIAGAPSAPSEWYESHISGQTDIKIIYNKTYQILENSHAAIVTSGTATLETALFMVPQVVCYKGSWMSYQIGKRLVSLSFISLVNLILNKRTVTELIQDECTPNNIYKSLSSILEGSKRGQILSDYYLLKEKLGHSGASSRAAQLIYDSINTKKNYL